MGLTSEEEYVDFENICVACNIQLIFLRNRKGNVLVKVLKNEQECSVSGLEPYSGPSYEWAALKAYMQSRSTLVNNSSLTASNHVALRCPHRLGAGNDVLGPALTV